MRTAVLATLAALGLTAAALTLTPLPYVYCLSQEATWLAAETQAELEASIGVPYTRAVVDPSASEWGSGRVLAPGEQMVQLRVLGIEPMEAVYDADGRVTSLYTSYE